VTERCALPAREHGAHLAAISCGDGTDLVDPAVQRDQPTALDAPRDRPASNPRIEELRGRDDAMLPRGEAQDRAITRCISPQTGAVRRVIGEFGTYTVRFSPIVGRGRRIGEKCTGGRHGPEDPTATPGPTPSMPQLKRRRHEFLTK
jgi:hypothetical protein